MKRHLQRTFSIAVIMLVGQPSFADDVDIGQRFYQRGLLADGSMVKATVQGDITVNGALLNCASCHRRSGYGDGEGGNYVPPITGSVLFSDYQPERQHLFRNLYQDIQSPATRSHVYQIRRRAAYNKESLKALLTTGINNSGTTISTQMPRFEIDDITFEALYDYLNTLGVQTNESLTDIGVEADTLHFASVFTPDVSPAEKASILAVFEAYLKRRNLNTHAAQSKPNYSSSYKSDFVYAQKKWTLHDWQLTGSMQEWPKQLAAYSQTQPVFAVLGGKGKQWRPVHEFCERQQLPCLFANTPLPVTEKDSKYTVYFSNGLVGEATDLANHLEKQSGLTHLTQLYRPASIGETAATVLDNALSTITSTHHHVDNHQVIDAAYWQSILELSSKKHHALILWINREDFESLPHNYETPIYTSASLLGLRNKPLEASQLNKRLSLVWPWALPRQEPKRLYRARAWMRSRNITLTHELEQLNTFFVLNLADYATHDLLDRFSREYFIEIVERITENALNPGLYKNMSLGPEQRFAVHNNIVIRSTQLSLSVNHSASDVKSH